uniref:SPX domain-containing protein n=1 Tax=Glossina pallidipes TaxID=7398 RepID=A0A1B0A5H6_GLOPL
MKFGKKLSAHLTPEWRQQYICYRDLKDMILHAAELRSTKPAHFISKTDSFFLNFEIDFLFKCEKELKKINTFFAEKLAEATLRYEQLVTLLDAVYGNSRLDRISASRLSLMRNRVIDGMKERGNKTKLSKLRMAFSELYLHLVLLQNYQLLNYTGFRKILKKYDKLLGDVKGREWFLKNVETAPFHTDRNLDNLISDVEYNVTEYLADGNRAEAMKHLRVPPLDEVQSNWTVFRFGLFAGAFVVLLIIIGIADFQGMVEVQHLVLFRGPFYIVVYLLLMAVNVYGWRRVGVNHILIFEIDPRRHLTYSHLLELSAIFGVLTALSVLGFIYAKNLHIPRFWFPLILLITMGVYLILPVPIFHLDSRLWLLKVMGRLIAAPFFSVNFADFWLGDQFNSMTIVFVDFKNLLCFYVRNPFLSENYKHEKCEVEDVAINACVSCLPAWLRFAQCLRQYRDNRKPHPYLTNAGKYATVFPTILFATLMNAYRDEYETFFKNPFLWCFIGFKMISTIYGLVWDIFGDFGLFKVCKKGRIFLRENVIYSKNFYYFLIIENFVLRFFWIFDFPMVALNHVNFRIMESISGLLEIIRYERLSSIYTIYVARVCVTFCSLCKIYYSRYIWNYVRLENEHLYNVGQYRAVRDIFIAPLEERYRDDFNELEDKTSETTIFS